MNFDFTINISHLLAFGAFFGSLIAAYFDIRRILGDHELRVRLSENSLLRQLEVNAQIAEALNLIRTDLAVIRVRAEKYEVAAHKVADKVDQQVEIVKEVIKDAAKKQDTP